MKRIAMWSGPRNLSTAMMYSFGNRGDTEVIDEPFYGVYLEKTGLNHPMRDEIIKAMPESEDEVIADLLKPRDKAILYQKHMTHHLLPNMRRDWISQMTNVFLIRHPARVIASYGVKREAFTIDDLGFTQQGELFDQLTNEGKAPIVVDSHSILKSPEQTLKKLCHALGIAFDESMLHWQKGGHPSDGIWAAHWYDSAHKSEGFTKAEGSLPAVSKEQMAIYEPCLKVYEKLSRAAID